MACSQVPLLHWLHMSMQARYPRLPQWFEGLTPLSTFVRSLLSRHMTVTLRLLEIYLDSIRVSLSDFQKADSASASAQPPASVAICACAAGTQEAGGSLQPRQQSRLHSDVSQGCIHTSEILPKRRGKGRKPARWLMGKGASTEPAGLRLSLKPSR